MSDQKKEGYEIIGVIKTVTFSKKSSPVVVEISKNTRTEDLSFQFGLLRRGIVNPVRYWREESVMQMAVLAKVVSELMFANKIGVVNISAENLKNVIGSNPHLELVEEFVPKKEQSDVSMTLGERAFRR